jgi:probable addiction module antidote protein
MAASGKKGRSKTTSVSYDEHLRKYLRDPEEAAEYLNACLDDPDPGVFLVGVRHVVNANGGIAAVARKTKLNRENIYKMLSPEGNPRLDSLMMIMSGIGFRMSFSLAPRKPSRAPAKRKRAA